MANPIVQQISAELENLQKELGQFKSTVDYLNGAKTNVNEAVQSVKHAEGHFNKKVEELKSTYDAFIKLTDAVTEVVSKVETINFPDRLDNIEKTIHETIEILNASKKSTLEELQKASEIITKADFDGRFKKLQLSIDSSVASNKDLGNTIENLKLPDKFYNFEIRITKKIDDSLTDLQKNTKRIALDTAKSIDELNFPTRVDKLDVNISGIMAAVQAVQSRIDMIERNITDRIKDLSEFQKDIGNAIATQSKKQKTNAFVTWSLIFIGVIVTIILMKL